MTYPGKYYNSVEIFDSDCYWVVEKIDDAVGRIEKELVKMRCKEGLSTSYIREKANWILEYCDTLDRKMWVASKE